MADNNLFISDSSRSCETGNQSQESQNTDMPCMQDVVTVHNYLDNELTVLNEISTMSYLRLGKALLAKMILFTGSQPSQIAGILMSDYLQMKQILASELAGLLDGSFFEIAAGKFQSGLQRNVVVTQEMKAAMDALVAIGHEVLKNKPMFVFSSLADSMTPLDGKQALMKAAKDAGVEKWQLFDPNVMFECGNVYAKLADAHQLKTIKVKRQIEQRGNSSNQ